MIYCIRWCINRNKGSHNSEQSFSGEEQQQSLIYSPENYNQGVSESSNNTGIQWAEYMNVSTSENAESPSVVTAEAVENVYGVQFLHNPSYRAPAPAPAMIPIVPEEIDIFAIPRDEDGYIHISFVAHQ